MFQFFSKKNLGVDIGTSAIRVVEVSKNKRLENYGEISFADFEKPFIYSEKNTLVLAEDNIAQALTALLSESQIKTKDAYFSLADFASFFTTFLMPAMKESELENAVQFEAKKYIPIPIEDVILDWQVIEELPDPKNPTSSLYKILAIAIAKDIVDQYQRIANKCGLNVLGFEAEVFSLARALLKNETMVTCLIDVGIKSTTVSIVEQGVVKDSHSLNFSGTILTQKAVNDLGIDAKQAEIMKMDKGLLAGSPLVASFTPINNILFNEISRLFHEYQKNSGKYVDRIVLSGGTALMPGFLQLIGSQFRLPQGVVIADAFSGLNCPPELENNLRRLSPQFAIATGLALKNL